jgi:hypothetical protein
MSEIVETNGPFTYLRADVSEEIARSTTRGGEQIGDEIVYRFVSPAEEMRFVGPPDSRTLRRHLQKFPFGGARTR